MCGIAGVYHLTDGHPPPSREVLAKMAGSMLHRGPDEFGCYRNHRVGLAHARLSIIDLSTGQQPLSNEDGTLFIVFNGEIFNYVELRAELEALGHRFHTKSDTEVIVHAWEAWGTAAFARMNGQWAVALYDEKRDELVLSRDRVGVRPLHFAEHDGRLFFASEVKTLFAADPSMPRELDPIGIDQTFTFWSIVPPTSVYRGVVELEPGHVRIWQRGRLCRDEAYHRPRYPLVRGEGPSDGFGFEGSLDEAVDKTREALERATSLRMLRADVPVGSYLSGGLDSSLVAALGKRAKGESFQTFSLRFADAEYDETEWQRAMVRHIDSQHHEVVVTRADIAEAFPDVIWHGERPVLRTAPAPLFLLSKLVREHGIKVVLTGEGADEMFAGYDLFREGKVRRHWARAPGSKCRPLLLDRLYPYLARSPVSQKAMAQKFFGRDLEHHDAPGFAHDLRWHGAAALKRLFSAEQRAAVGDVDATSRLLASLPPELSRWSPLAQDQYLEIRTLLSGYLLSSQGDRMLMGHSVEGRFPFLDADVMELAASLPASHKLRVLDEKHVLKRASEGLIPEGIARRKKQPYRAPDALSFVTDPVPEWVPVMLSEEVTRRAGVFAPDAVRNLWGKCRARKDESQFSNADNMALVGILSLHLAHESLCRSPRAIPTVTMKTLVDRVSP